MRALITLVALFIGGCSTPQAVDCPPLDKELFGKSRVEISVTRPLMDTSPFMTAGKLTFHKEILNGGHFEHATYIFESGHLVSITTKPRSNQEAQAFMGKLNAAYNGALTYVVSTKQEALYWELPSGEVFVVSQKGSVMFWVSMDSFYKATRPT